MKVAIVLLAMVGVTMACSTQEIRDEFEFFKKTYRRSYASEEENQRRCEIFGKNYLRITEHNNNVAARGSDAYFLEINNFADKTYDEVVSTYTGYNPMLADEFKKNTKTYTYKPSFNKRQTPPASKDYRAEGKVTPIENQGACGSCYAFASTHNMESIYLIKSGKTFDEYSITLSEQQIIECTTEDGNKLCNGGHMKNVGKSNLGLMSDKEYAYESGNGSNGTYCRHDPLRSVLRFRGLVEIPRDEKLIIDALAKVGPLAIAVHANQDWFSYKSGIFKPKPNDCPSLAIQGNHAVLLVGYGPDYWIIKNSWGEDWGEKGYIRMAKRTQTSILYPSGQDNVCGINNAASYFDVIV